MAMSIEPTGRRTGYVGKTIDRARKSIATERSGRWNLGFMADAQIASLVVGARVPVILTSRSDTAVARRFLVAVAVPYADALARVDPTILLPETAE
jgi:hypothetical protein